MANSYSIDLEQGSSQYLSRTDANLSSDFPGKSSTGHTGDTTWEGWFNFESAGGDRLFGKYATGQKCFYCVYSSNLMYFGISANGTTDNDTTWSWTPTTGTWYHLAFVYDASAGSVEFFVNGVSQGANTGYATSLQQTTADFEIGDYTIRNAYFDGKVDDFRIWTVARTPTEISNNFNKELTGNETNLVGYWKLNNNANDSTSNGNNLTLNNSPVYSTTIPFVEDRSLDLERGSSQYLSITDASQTGLDITGDITIEAWVNFESIPASSNLYMVGKWNVTGNQRGYVLLYNTTTSAILFATSADGTSGTQVNLSHSWSPSTSIWYHIAYTYDASAGTGELFVNGVSQNTASGGATSLYNNTADFEIGAVTGTNTWDGKLDDVRVWNDIRTATEIANNYNKRLTGNEAGLVGYWQFNNNANDFTTNNNHLTENNSPTYSTDIPSFVSAVSPTYTFKGKQITAISNIKGKPLNRIFMYNGKILT